MADAQNHEIFMCITGRNELEMLSFDWKTVAPGMLSGKCCATGTCGIDTRNPGVKFEKITQVIPNEFDNTCAKKLKKLYGVLRKAA